MDPEITQELRKVVRAGLHEIERDALGLVPVDTGDLAQSIEVKISPDGLAGIVGPGVRAAEAVRSQTGSAFGRTLKRGAFQGQSIVLSEGRKHDLMQYFKGYWIEFGTKGSPEHHIPPQAPRPFMTPAFLANKERFKRAVKLAIDRALRRAVNG